MSLCQIILELAQWEPQARTTVLRNTRNEKPQKHTGRVFPSGKGRAFTRCISIPFIEHKDEPNAPQLYSNLKECRTKASASAGVFIRLSTRFTSDDAQMLLRGDLFPNTAALYQNAHARFKTMMTIFMYFFLKVYIDCHVVVLSMHILHIVLLQSIFFTACRSLWSCWGYMLGFCMQSDGATGHGRLLQHQ